MATPTFSYWTFWYLNLGLKSLTRARLRRDPRPKVFWVCSLALMFLLEWKFGRFYLILHLWGDDGHLISSVQNVDIQVICKVTLCFTPYTLFGWYPQSKEILLNLSVKSWYSAFNVQRSRVIMLVVQVRAVKIYVIAVEALRKKERGHETQFTSKKTSLNPSYFAL
jgi:hypothetical protein